MTTIRHRTCFPAPGDSFHVLLQKFAQIIEDLGFTTSAARLGDDTYLVLYRIMETSAAPPAQLDAFRTILETFYLAAGSPKIPNQNDYQRVWDVLLNWAVY